MEITLIQIIGILIGIILTSVIAIFGYQATLILIEIRKTIIKLNKLVEDTNQIIHSIKKPALGLSGFINGFKDGSKLIKLLTDKSTKSKNEKKQNS